MSSSPRFAVAALLISLCGAANASVQSCNTRCQTAQTDCDLRCDGAIPCITQCQTSADSCADACLR